MDWADSETRKNDSFFTSLVFVIMKLFFPVLELNAYSVPHWLVKTSVLLSVFKVAFSVTKDL